MKKLLIFLFAFLCFTSNVFSQFLPTTTVTTQPLGGGVCDFTVNLVYDVAGGAYPRSFMYSHTYTSGTSQSYTFPLPSLKIGEFITSRILSISVSSQTADYSYDLNTYSGYEFIAEGCSCVIYNLSGSGSNFTISYGCPVGG